MMQLNAALLERTKHLMIIKSKINGGLRANVWMKTNEKKTC